MVFVNDLHEFPLYLVWKHCLGGDYLVKVYQHPNEAEDKRKQILKRGWNENHVWIQIIKPIKLIGFTNDTIEESK